MVDNLRRRFMPDAAASALDAANEESLYRQFAASQTTLVSVAHRAGILKYHRHVLELLGDGEWQIHPAQGYDFRH